MPANTLKLSTAVTTRLTMADKDKLARLCAHAHRQPSDLLRVLIRLAQPINVPCAPVAFLTTDEEREGRGS